MSERRERKKSVGPTSWAMAVVVVMIFSGQPATAQWAAWSFYFENDSFAFDNGSDARYTNGVRVTLSADDEWGWAESVKDRFEGVLMGDSPYEFSNALVFGQNFFTPNLITTYENQPEDRPFAGLLYLGARLQFTEDVVDSSSVRDQHSFEFVFGTLGQPSLSETFQKTVHIIRESRIPKGWDHQLRTEPVVQLSYEWRRSWRAGLLDIVPHVGVGLGTVQTLGRGGLTFRFGTVQSFPSILIPVTVAPTAASSGSFRWAILAGGEFRGFLHNTFVDGGLFQGPLDIESNHAIKELRLGAMLEAWGWHLNYTRVFRGAEFVAPPSLGVGEGNHNFGSITIGRTLAGTSRSQDGKSWWANDWIFELSMGSGRSWERGPLGNDEGNPGGAIRLSASKGLNEHILLGFEWNGALYEHGPPDASGLHRDTFYVTKAFTLGWRPWGRSRFFVLRGGMGWGLGMTQETVIQNLQEVSRVDLNTDTRLGVVLGASYGIRLGDRASLGLDLNWSDIFDVEDAGGFAASYLSWGIGLKWHP